MSGRIWTQYKVLKISRRKREGSVLSWWLRPSWYFWSTFVKICVWHTYYVCLRSFTPARKWTTQSTAGQRGCLTNTILLCCKYPAPLTIVLVYIEVSVGECIAMLCSICRHGTTLHSWLLYRSSVHPMVVQLIPSELVHEPRTSLLSYKLAVHPKHPANVWPKTPAIVRAEISPPLSVSVSKQKLGTIPNVSMHQPLPLSSSFHAISPP